MIEAIGLDADDTLWENETFFRVTEAEFASLLADHAEIDDIAGRLYEVECANLERYGFGIKGFVLSMVQTAIELTDGRIDGQAIGRILELGRDMLAHPVELFDGVEETLERLRSRQEHAEEVEIALSDLSVDTSAGATSARMAAAGCGAPLRPDAAQVLDRLRAAGFDNINLDLMFAIPGQTMDIWKATMAETIAMGSEHLSCYEVIYEEDTPLYEQLQAGEFDVDEALACAMYDELIDTAAAAGFAQYEVANFAQHDGEPSAELPSRACRHNVNYWRGGACQALGPSASGYVDGRRIRNIANTERYCEQLVLGQRAHESVEQLSPLASAGETAAFGLRMNAGWPFGLFEQTTGHDLRADWAGDMQRAVESDWGVRSDDRFHLTRQGMRFADTVAEWFIRPEP